MATLTGKLSGVDLSTFASPEEYTKLRNDFKGLLEGFLSGEYEVPNWITKLNYHAFQGQVNLTKITLPDNITEIGSATFIDCTNLKELILSNNLTDIPYGIISYTAIEHITIPSKVKTLSPGALSYAKSLKTIYFYGTPTSIGNTSFQSSTAITDIYVPWSENEVSNAPWAAPDTAIIHYNTIYNTNGSPIEKPEGDITTIANNAYEGNTNLQSMVIPEGVISIGNRAFAKCTNLTDITFPATLQSIGIGTFDQCYKLKNIMLPENLTSIAVNAFYACRSIETIKIPAKVTTIGRTAFGVCNNLKTVYFLGKPSSIPDPIFDTYTANLTDIYVPWKEGDIPNAPWGAPNATVHYNTKYDSNGNVVGESSSDGTIVVIPDGTTNIADEAYKNNTTVITVIIPEGVTTIGTRSFQGCSKLEKVILPSTLVEIGQQAFDGCGKLNSINLPEGLTTIKTSSFVNNKSLTTITIPSTVTTLSGYNLFGCIGLTDVYFLGKPTSVPANMFNNTTQAINVYVPWSEGEVANYPWGNSNIVIQYDTEYDENGKPYEKGLLIIPDGTTAIAQNAYKDRTDITKVIIPEGVTSIGTYAFYGCSELVSISFPNSLTNIDGYACFTNCDKLTTLTFPETIERIASYTFTFEDNLKTIYFKGTPSSLAANIFYNSEAITDIYVPWENGTVNNAPWGATNATVHYNTTYNEDGTPKTWSDD